MRYRIFIFLSFLFGTLSLATASAGATSHSRKVCATTPPPGSVRCHAIVLTDGGGVQPMVSGNPQGYSPADFKAAYNTHGTSSNTVGVVVAYDAPNIVNDVNTFSKAFGLSPLLPCSTNSQKGCLQKLSQTGSSSSLPATNSSWALETSLDVESVHGMCPGCRINLVEASSATMANLGTAVDTAVAAGSTIVSNSYGGAESSGESLYDRHYNKPGINMIVSSGDSGYGTNYPAASPYVTAVGGTSLKMKGAKVISETAWSGAGSGCSLFEIKPTWQNDKRCLKRAVSDVSADADPQTGAAIYDSYATSGRSGWFTVGGTSLASPLVAGIIASVNNVGNLPNGLYSKASVLRDITSGNNGSCSVSYLCQSIKGYDGPTGLGVLSGI